MLYPLHQAQTDFSINYTSWMKNKVKSDAVLTCIGSRLQVNVLQFGQNHKISPYSGSIFLLLILLSLNPLIGIKLPKIYCYRSILMKYIDITTNYKKLQG